jgi:phage terminase large subunit-like protein
MSALGLYMLAGDREPGATVVSAATTAQQARIVFGTSQAMLRRMPWCKDAGIVVEAHAIHQPATNSSFRPLSSEAGGAEGLSPYMGIIDELHLHANRALWDSISTGCGKRANSMLWAISTAGNDRSSVGFDVHSYLLKVLEGSLIDDSFFGCVWTKDPEDDPWCEETWKKCNPSWGICVLPEEISAKAHAAKQNAASQNAFFVKHLNTWVAPSKAAFMDMTRFCRCIDKSLNEEAFAGQPCVIGVDLGAQLDLLAAMKIFWKRIDGKLDFFCFGTYWTNENQIETGNSSYRGWAADGWLRVSPGDTNDFALVERFIIEAAAKYNVREMSIDRWQAEYVSTRLQAEGINVVNIPQYASVLSRPMKELELAVFEKRFHCQNDPVFLWAMSNVTNKMDKNENYFPDKDGKENKIDPVSALLNGMNGVLVRHADAESEPDDEHNYVAVAGGICEICRKPCLAHFFKGCEVNYCPEHKEEVLKHIR